MNTSSNPKRSALQTEREGLRAWLIDRLASADLVAEVSLRLNHAFMVPATK